MKRLFVSNMDVPTPSQISPEGPPTPDHVQHSWNYSYSRLVVGYLSRTRGGHPPDRGSTSTRVVLSSQGCFLERGDWRGVSV